MQLVRVRRQDGISRRDNARSNQASNWVWDLDLGKTQKLIMTALASFARWPIAMLWPGQAIVARMESASTDTVARTYAALEERGLIARVKCHNSQGHRVSDLIVLLANEESRGVVERLRVGDPEALSLLPESRFVTTSNDRFSAPGNCGLGAAPDRMADASQPALLRVQEPIIEPLLPPYPPQAEFPISLRKATPVMVKAINRVRT